MLAFSKGATTAGRNGVSEEKDWSGDFWGVNPNADGRNAGTYSLYGTTVGFVTRLEDPVAQIGWVNYSWSGTAAADDGNAYDMVMQNGNIWASAKHPRKYSFSLSYL